MIALVVVPPLRRSQDRLNKMRITSGSWWRRFVVRFVEWLTEPIGFPGQWPANAGERKRVQ
jgi:hypothetical protein